MRLQTSITRLSATLLTGLTILAANATPSHAQATREFITSFGYFPSAPYTVSDIAVDLETGNAYVTEKVTQNVYIYGPEGGAPVGGVPSEITGLHFLDPESYSPAGIAVDNSCFEHVPRLTGQACEEYDPSYGDVYVVEQEDPARNWNLKHGIDKFKLNAKHEYEIVEKISEEGGPEGLAVDPHGNLYFTASFEGPIEFKKVLEKVVNAGKEEVQEHLEEIRYEQRLITKEAGYIAADGMGDIYLGKSAEIEPLGVGKIEVGSQGEVIKEETFAGPLEEGGWRPVALNPASGNVLIGDGSYVAEYDAAGELQLAFGSEGPLGGSLGKELTGVKGIAVNPGSEPGSERVYVVNPLHRDVDVFGPVSGLPVFEGQQPDVSGLSRTSALIGGAVNPESAHASYIFEYVAASEYEAGAANPYRAGVQTSVGSLSGHTLQTVERIPLTGLLPGTTYHYRMVVSNGSGTTDGPDETFTTSAATPPVASTGPAVEVGATSVTLTGTVSPRGLPTSYVFEVGTDTGYDGAKLFGNAGDSTGELSVSVPLDYLVPGVTYHYRLSATSFDGTSHGQDGTFTTASATAPLAQPSSAPLLALSSMSFPSLTESSGAQSGGKKSKKHKKTRRRRARSKRHAARRSRPRR